jgi:hypothetical protein
VIAVDILPGAAQVCRARGIRDVRTADLRESSSDGPHPGCRWRPPSIRAEIQRPAYWPPFADSMAPDDTNERSSIDRDGLPLHRNRDRGPFERRRRPRELGPQVRIRAPAASPDRGAVLASVTTGRGTTGSVHSRVDCI